MNQERSTGQHKSNVNWSGRIYLPEDQIKKAIDNIEGWDVRPVEDGLILIPLPNLVVDSGVQRSLDRVFGINGPPTALVREGVDNGASNPVAGTTQSGAATKTLLLFDSTPTRTANVVTAVRTFTNANVNFIMKRLFLSAHTADITNATTADTAGTLYSMTNVFTIDFTGITTWTAVFSATVTGVGA